MYYLLIFYNNQTGQLLNIIPVEDDSNDTLRFYCHCKIRHIAPSISSSFSVKRMVEFLESVNISYYFYNLEDVKNIIRGMVN